MPKAKAVDRLRTCNDRESARWATLDPNPTQQAERDTTTQNIRR